MTTELFENALQARGIFVLACTENILKAKLFENDEITITIV